MSMGSAMSATLGNLNRAEPWNVGDGETDGSSMGKFAFNKPDPFPGLGRADELEICRLCCCNQGIVPIDRAEPVPRPSSAVALSSASSKAGCTLRKGLIKLGHVPGDAVSVSWKRTLSLADPGPLR